MIFLTLRAVAVVWGDATGAEVNRAMDEPRLQTVRQSVVPGVPVGGGDSWKVGIATRVGLYNRLRPGAPREGLGKIFLTPFLPDTFSAFLSAPEKSS